MGIHDAAKRIGLDVFEVVRLLVASGQMPEHLQLSREQVDALREVGGVDLPWWDSVTLPEDGKPSRARVRAALQQLLDRGHVGDALTRMDNVWRGLPDADQVLLQAALTVLGEEGHLAIVATPVGVKVAIPAGAEATIRSIADGSADPDGLAALYQE